jgi:hypothetical protein
VGNKEDRKPLANKDEELEDLFISTRHINMYFHKPVMNICSILTVDFQGMFGGK